MSTDRLETPVVSDMEDLERLVAVHTAFERNKQLGEMLLYLPGWCKKRTGGLLMKTVNTQDLGMMRDRPKEDWLELHGFFAELAKKTKRRTMTGFYSDFYAFACGRRGKMKRHDLAIFKDRALGDAISTEGRPSLQLTALMQYEIAMQLHDEGSNVLARNVMKQAAKNLIAYYEGYSITDGSDAAQFQAASWEILRIHHEWGRISRTACPIPSHLSARILHTFGHLKYVA